MPAQPSTIASARSSSSARAISPRSFAGRAGGRIIERQHRNIGGPHARPAGHAVAVDQMFDRHARALHRRHHGEALCDEGGGRERRLADADHGNARHRARGVQPGVVEAGDDGGVGAFALAPGDLDQQSRHRQCFVVVALDRDRAHRRGDGNDFARRRGHRARSRGDRRGHAGGGVGVDDEDAHQGHVRRRARRRLSQAMMPSVAAMTMKEKTVVTVPSAYSTGVVTLVVMP